MAILYFRWNSNTLFFPIISALFYGLQYYSDYILNNGKFGKEKYEVIQILIYCIADMSNIFIELVRYFIVGRKKNSHLKSLASSNTEKEKQNNKRKSTVSSILMIILFTILDLYPSIFSSMILKEIPYNKSEETETYFVTSAAMVKMFRFIYFSMLMYFFFRNPLFIHQKLGIAIIVIGILCILIIGEFLRIWGGTTNVGYLLLYILVYLVNYFFSSSKAIIAKWLMDFKYFSPYLLLTIIGFIKLIMASISYVIIQYGFKGCSYNFCNSFSGFFKKEIFDDKTIYFVLLFIGNMLTRIFYMLTINFLSPVYIGIADGIGAMCIWIMFIIINDTNHPGLLILTIVFFILIIFGGMIYTENLILSFCGLDKDTKESIIQRGNNSYQRGNDAFIEIESINKEALVKDSSHNEFIY